MPACAPLVLEAAMNRSHPNYHVAEKSAEQRNGSPWPDPVPISPVPTRRRAVKVSALPTWAHEHAVSIARATQVPESMVVALALSALAGALQKTAVVKVKEGFTVPLSLWTCSVLGSGERKSPTFRAMTAPITEYEQAERERLAPHIAEAKEKQEILKGRHDQAKKAAVKGGPMEAVQEARTALEAHDVPATPKLWSADTTPEALARDLSVQGGRMIIMSAEGDFFTYIGPRYDGSGSLEIYKAGWTGSESFRDTRMGREGHDIANPAVSVGICVQPDVLKRLRRAREFRGEGILARFLWVFPESMVGDRMGALDAPPVDGAAAAEYARQIRKLLQLPRSDDPPEITLSSDAEDIWSEFEAEIEKRQRENGDLRYLRDWAGKLPGQALRIAGILEIAENGRVVAEISGDAMIRACDLADSFVSHAKAVFGLIGQDERTERAAYVLERIHAKWKLGFSKADLWQACKDKAELATSSDLDAPLSLLQEAGHIQLYQRSSTGGRPPSPVIDLNPKSKNTL